MAANDQKLKDGVNKAKEALDVLKEEAAHEDREYGVRRMLTSKIRMATNCLADLQVHFSKEAHKQRTQKPKEPRPPRPTVGTLDTRSGSTGLPTPNSPQ